MNQLTRSLLNRTTSIAQGASTIGAMQITAQDFIDRGPAQLGVQMRQAGSKLWDNVAQIVSNVRWILYCLCTGL